MATGRVVFIRRDTRSLKIGGRVFNDTANVNVRVVRTDDSVVVWENDYPEGRMNWVDLELILRQSGANVRFHGKEVGY